MQPVKPDTAAPSEGNPPSAAAGNQARRRQFLRASAGVVPVTLTLASRPVRAWHCNTSSAWGSEQVSPNASTTARNNSNEITDETWTISNWQTNTTRAGLPQPWSKVKTKWGFSSMTKAQTGTPAIPGTKKKPAVDAVPGLTVAQLFAGGPTPAGLAGTDMVYNVLNGKDANNHTAHYGDFPKFMIVAKLNAIFIPAVASCLASNGQDQLPDMIDGTFQPSNAPSTLPWNDSTIMKYLTDNYIVVRQ